MLIMYKTRTNGTISAGRHDYGIALGKYASDSICSFEEDDEGNLVLLLNDDVINEWDVKIRHVNRNWE